MAAIKLLWERLKIYGRIRFAYDCSMRSIVSTREKMTIARTGNTSKLCSIWAKYTAGQLFGNNTKVVFLPYESLIGRDGTGNTVYLVLRPEQ